MSTKLKLYIGRKILDSIKRTSNLSPVQIKHLFVIGNPQSENDVEINISLTALENYLGVSNVSEVFKIKQDDIIEDIRSIKDRANRKISFKINRSIFMKEIIENSSVPDINPNKKNIVVEFSSPNIAKPFHMGHLRSTIIGNFIANVFKFSSNSVTKLNYLGDWGTQLGLIKVGMDELKLNKDDLEKQPLKCCYDSYVLANKLAETDTTILDRAREIFHSLEKGSIQEVNQWKLYIEYTSKELKAMYNRLGVTFDEYNYESMYNAGHIRKVMEELKDRNVIQTDKEGKQNVKFNNRSVTLIKSDGSTLYLSRDLAAAIDRYQKYKFDAMYYVVDNAQTDHFNALKYILHEMDKPWAHRLHHVKFGRIRGMSTRKGTSIFLSDILDEIKTVTAQRQVASPTTKVPITDEKTTDILGVSCVIVNDLKQRRQKDYSFDWDRVLQVQGDSGIKLQYTHCRLYSLEQKAGITAATECVPELLSQPEATILVRELAKFPDIINKSQQQLEACILVNYLFSLCNQISKALKVLRVKDENTVIASQRLLLFNTAREVLKQGMSILGLQPLNEM